MLLSYYSLILVVPKLVLSPLLLSKSCQISFALFLKLQGSIRKWQTIPKLSSNFTLYQKKYVSSLLAYTIKDEKEPIKLYLKYTEA